MFNLERLAGIIWVLGVITFIVGLVSKETNVMLVGIFVVVINKPYLR